MNKVLITFLIFSTVILCSQLTQSVPACLPAMVSDTTDVNPNGSSELSILMRKMYDHAAAARVQVTSGKLLNTFPREFLSIYTAAPTDSFTKNNTFNPFADAYLLSLNQLTSSGKENLVENYNGLVTACITCHSQHCPGPVPKMKKLLIPEVVK
jgi:hypothetical protein